MPPREQSFVPRERTALPRILLIDYTDSDAQSLIDAGYTIYRGYSGLSGTPYELPCHESELEIIFWDTRNHLNDNHILVGGAQHIIGSPRGQEIVNNLVRILGNYVERMRQKGGFVATFLGNQQAAYANSQLSDILLPNALRGFAFQRRLTTTLSLEPNGDEDVWFEFFKRFVQEDDITYGVDWQGNFVGLHKYFTDEDENWFAIYQSHIALVPYVRDNRMVDATKFLLQDVLPRFCDGDDIFPEKYYFHWANSPQYLPPRVQELKTENQRIKDEYERQKEVNDTAIEEELDEQNYLTALLFTDDSDLFPEGSRLSDHVQTVLESDLGFSVTDVDEMRLEVGESLKEDKWIEDDGYFALVEIKGTERGAKANWVRTDLNAHIKEFETVRGDNVENAIVIFNHERRIDPQDRNAPFNGDNDLIEYCRKANILLIPAYELFKLTRDVKASVLTASDARELIKSSNGLFSYPADVTNND